jgi:FAD/FMN-containing dehydrogenase
VSVLPSELAGLSGKIDVSDAIWQIGAADGRIRMLDNSVPESMIERPAGNADALMQRVKQQLDPSNKFRRLEV